MFSFLFSSLVYVLRRDSEIVLLDESLLAYKRVDYNHNTKPCATAVTPTVAYTPHSQTNTQTQTVQRVSLGQAFILLGVNCTLDFFLSLEK